MTNTASQTPGRGNSTLRLLDRHMGIPVVAAAGVLRRKRHMPTMLTRIGIFKSSAIGDTVLLSAVVEDVARAFPDAEIVFFAGQDNAAAARLLEKVKVVEVTIPRPVNAVRLLRREHVDVLLDFGPWPRIEAVYSALATASYTAGFESAGQYRHYLYDTTVRHSSRMHELENYRRLLGAIGIEPGAPPRVPDPGMLPVERLPTGPYVVFHLWPGGFRSHFKEWPPERWRALARRSIDADYAVLLTGSRSDEDATRGFVRSSGELGSRLVDLSGLSLAEVVSVVCGSAAVVSVNTGLMHLAAAAGAPTVGLNGPTSELRWGPVGERAVSVNSEFGGCGFLNLGFEYGTGRADCMRGISVDRVFEAMRGVMLSE